MKAYENGDITTERRVKILELLEKNGKVSVNNLSKSFKVSEVTIRNDLDVLEKKNLLIRMHGGAIQVRRVALDYQLNVKAKRHAEEKRAIGEKAAGVINDGETIILDSGTTTEEIAKNLIFLKDLTVITNSLNVAIRLSELPGVHVIVPGGYLRKKALSLIGSNAEENIKRYYCDKVFIGVDGIDSEYGISTPNVEEAHLNNIMINISREVIVVTDSSKFKHRSFAKIAPISKINTIITDKNIPSDEKEKLEKMGINLILV